MSSQCPSAGPRASDWPPCLQRAAGGAAAAARPLCTQLSCFLNTYFRIRKNTPSDISEF